MSTIKERAKKLSKKAMIGLALTGATLGTPSEAEAATPDAPKNQTEFVTTPERGDPPTAEMHFHNDGSYSISPAQGTQVRQGTATRVAPRTQSAQVSSGSEQEWREYVSAYFPHIGQHLANNPHLVIDTELSQGLQDDYRKFAVACYDSRTPKNDKQTIYYFAKEVGKSTITINRKRANEAKMNGSTEPYKMHAVKVRIPVHTTTVKIPGYEQTRSTDGSSHTRVAGGVYDQRTNRNGDTRTKIDIDKATRKTTRVIREVDKSKKTRNATRKIDRIIGIFR